jgi:hypothetical protein
VLLNGREIDTSCPYSGGCFADQHCATECPPTLLDVLIDSARLEHECDMLPHTDPDLMEVCTMLSCVVKRKARSLRE